MTYVHMGKPHTSIGAASFHRRVRDGIGWCQRALAARPNRLCKSVGVAIAGMIPKRLGCYMVKPHGPLVRVSCTRYRASTPRLSTSSSPTDLQEP